MKISEQYDLALDVFNREEEVSVTPMFRKNGTLRSFILENTLYRIGVSESRCFILNKKTKKQTDSITYGDAILVNQIFLLLMT